MKRQTYRASIHDDAGAELASVDKYAVGSAIDATLTLLRERARTRGHHYNRGQLLSSLKVDGVFRHTWHASDGSESLTAIVRQAS